MRSALQSGHSNHEARLKFDYKRILEKQGTSVSESERCDKNAKKGLNP